MLEQIMNNLGTDKFCDKYGLAKTKNAMFLLHRDKAKCIGIETLKNGAWKETMQLFIKIKNKVYEIKWKVKLIEDKSFQFSNGKYYVNCLSVTKPQWKVLE